MNAKGKPEYVLKRAEGIYWRLHKHEKIWTSPIFLLFKFINLRPTIIAPLTINIAIYSTSICN